MLPSRVLLAPINTGFTVRNLPSARLLRFHRERSGPAIGISMVGNVAVGMPVRTNDRTAVLGEHRELPRYAALARTISRRGSLSGIQLASAPTDLRPRRRWRTPSSGNEEERLRYIIRSYGDDELDELLSRFVSSSLLAERAGYDVVQIHCAHGYLLSLLLHPATNRRSGRYSVSAPWFEDFLGRVRARLGESLLSIRLSAVTGLRPRGEEIAWTRAVMDRAASSGVDMIDLSSGFYTVDRRLIYPGREREQPVYSEWLGALSRELPCLVAVAGRFTGPDSVPERLPHNLLFSVGRSLIADPAFATKLMDGRLDRINRCTLTNRCHYFSRGKAHIECGVNPHL
ncbi:MAG: hypothetical protein AVDCRST_MAG93-4231 [uncultured Chloroflexia bacterium]|uniref:NADH:flavin oxidoreductase/NADH oxidase N-terminal domain-containing protein n=1 Tax=uncultured Chloroflexia bacterium TaxID=1672391 RepID=A0A6J4K5Q2_9CHLR|nr:MAG: hypothetical protein AVDCRST_MAG93-4231 [uncultured Chloroflexia bacterium]